VALFIFNYYKEVIPQKELEGVTPSYTVKYDTLVKAVTEGTALIGDKYPTGQIELEGEPKLYYFFKKKIKRCVGASICK
tara:strand:+ start:1174 stop:1410 length:237 start_codon:yes stop_codon:yes gene_type:complete